ncbi:MAG TPA: hypothetical protein VHU43_07090 [Steroidobacteraceae bacterium]|jgi:hypothetical protein|nr:hypothetical protein [Steroidobacteraceae bacterium]
MPPEPQTRPQSCPRTVALFTLSGFLAGFVGPMILSPDSNLGPIIGILFSGPAGLVLGVIACVLARHAPRVFTTGVLRSLAAVLVVVTLFHCFPKPRAIESVLDAEVIDCAPPADLYAAALSKWQAALAGARQAHPLPDWQDRARRNVDAFEGVAVTLRITRSRIIFERRKPWNRGERFAGPWLQGAAEERAYFVPPTKGPCADWRAREPALYWPVRDETERPIPPAATWPPVDAAGFLSLQEIGPVPARISALLN